MKLFDLGDFPLRCGITLPGARLAYRTHGTLNAAKDNAILFPNFLGGAPEALEAWIGEGRALDPRKYFIVLPGQFGLAPSTAPSTAPALFAGEAFPEVRVADDVIAQHRLLIERFGIGRLRLVLGWSVGALQVYEWAVRYPDAVARMVSIAGAPRPAPWARLWLREVLEAQLTAGPTGEAAKRRMARLCAITVAPPGFYREGMEGWRPLGFDSADDYLARFWEAFWLPHDPLDVIAQSRKARAADPAEGGDQTAALGRITAKAFVAACAGDPMFPPADCRSDAERIPGAEFREIGSALGHMATFGLSEADVKAIDGLLSDALNGDA